LLQLYAEVFVGVQLLSDVYQHLREVGVDSPVSIFVCLCQSVARNFSTDATMVEFGLHCSQTGFDVPKALSICYLSKSHTEVLIEAGKSFYPMVATVSSNTSVELFSG